MTKLIQSQQANDRLQRTFRELKDLYQELENDKLYDNLEIKKVNLSEPAHERARRPFRELVALYHELENDASAGKSEISVSFSTPRLIPITSTKEPSAMLVNRKNTSEGSTVLERLNIQKNTGSTKLFTPNTILILYLFGIILAETLTTLSNPMVGVICHAVILTGLFMHSALTSSQTYRRILVTLSLAPLIRIISLSLPLQDYIFSYWYMLVGAPLFLSAILVARNADLRPAEIGLNFSKWPLQILFGVVGIGLGYVEYQILRPQPLSNALTLEQIWLPGLILVIFTGLLEEVIFRGLMQKAFVDGLGRFKGVLFVSIVFAVLHVGYQSALDVLFVFGVALLFGFIALRSRSILGVTLAHGLTNFSLFLVYPFLFP